MFAYEFENPKFIVSHVKIEHDEKGNGRIWFKKQDFEVDETESIQISAHIMERLEALWGELAYLSDGVRHQSEERDYGHLGTMTLTVNRDGVKRTDSFNWTENSKAKDLTDEYKKISNQFIWVFDMEVARKNQPLEAPRIMKSIDSYIRRDSISDPEQLLPYLRKLQDDERIPLIARNHAGRLVERIEKSRKD
ncbi:MAG: hypothetical protein DWQ47_00455 [Acidobacteria bacterium]|nr:MAG: hypothetical protein DWQ32_10915 [Acidobacteriota bacterium]REK03980.1 MAG: hypothetical protein DWQ38_00440 [Acidobacteriota bacterium]REK15142.1 MAG: hypothetical protein DWQ43_16605 [Acidobacteriota bacterium]REK46232.1 MAG: hypothetical protein DWQ47_00455 [Acidobacteriota bacterium]